MTLRISVLTARPLAGGCRVGDSAGGVGVAGAAFACGWGEGVGLGGCEGLEHARRFRASRMSARVFSFSFIDAPWCRADGRNRRFYGGPRSRTSAIGEDGKQISGISYQETRARLSGRFEFEGNSARLGRRQLHAQGGSGLKTGHYIGHSTSDGNQGPHPRRVSYRFALCGLT
jgi:hypothetical protein